MTDPHSALVPDVDAIERHPCPRCGTEPGSPCHSRGGAVAGAHHTGRFTKVPRLTELLRSATPADRGSGQPWRPGPRPWRPSTRTLRPPTSASATRAARPSAGNATTGSTRSPPRTSPGTRSSPRRSAPGCGSANEAAALALLTRHRTLGPACRADPQGQPAQADPHWATSPCARRVREPPSRGTSEHLHGKPCTVRRTHGCRAGDYPCCPCAESRAAHGTAL
ncbi:zinc finger domain-containing protein [Streptomyces macrosporus]|uniref:zinc finger domain-containing protein n=1 Tax=Streptomyces macrosporus TaxID=44032 RepID=UPI003CD064EE